MVNLQQLSVQGNRLTAIEGLDCLVNLEELFLSENNIKEISGLDNLVSREREREIERERERERERENLVTYFISQRKLKILDLAYNKITHLTNVSHLSVLEDFWVREIVNYCITTLIHVYILRKRIVHLAV